MKIAAIAGENTAMYRPVPVVIVVKDIGPVGDIEPWEGNLTKEHCKALSCSMGDAYIRA